MTFLQVDALLTTHTHTYRSSLRVVDVHSDYIQPCLVFFAQICVCCNSAHGFHSHRNHIARSVLHMHRRFSEIGETHNYWRLVEWLFDVSCRRKLMLKYAIGAGDIVSETGLCAIRNRHTHTHRLDAAIEWCTENVRCKFGTMCSYKIHAVANGPTNLGTRDRCDAIMDAKKWSIWCRGRLTWSEIILFCCGNELPLDRHGISTYVYILCPSHLTHFHFPNLCAPLSNASNKFIIIRMRNKMYLLSA